MVNSGASNEGKGAVVGYIARQYDIHVRVGAANAGHTVYTRHSASEEPGAYRAEKHVLQQLPCAAYCNPDATLVLGAGALISLEILEQEIHDNRQWRDLNSMPPLTLRIDERAHVVKDNHVEEEARTNLAAQIGSTSTIAREGIGAAQAARAMRTNYQTAADVWERLWIPLSDDTIMALDDTADYLHCERAKGSNILLEGTQGTSLSNTTGYYPYVTSRNVTASGLAADCGIGPRDVDSVIMVCRSYPIRVAGNSGPFWPDSKEISWEDIGINAELERTTVTKKVRRVATMSLDQIAYNAKLNSATAMVLTFADYLDPTKKDYESMAPIRAEETDRWAGVGAIIRAMEDVTMVPVTMVGCGPDAITERLTDLP